jgi:hypothetical protein
VRDVSLRHFHRAIDARNEHRSERYIKNNKIRKSKTKMKNERKSRLSNSSIPTPQSFSPPERGRARVRVLHKSKVAPDSGVVSGKQKERFD